MKKLQKWGLLLALALLFAVPAAAALYDDAYDMFLDWEQNGYPEYVAGVYSADGGTELAIQLVSGQEDKADVLQAVTEAPLTIEYGAAYSYNELKRINDEIVAQYMAVGGSAVVSCGVGWTSVDGETIGFGESGKEFRVVVGVLPDRAEEYAGLFQEKYGGAVVVESGDGFIAEDSLAREELAPDTGRESGWSVGYVLLTLLIVALAAGSLWVRYGKRRVVRTADGDEVTVTRVSRREARDAVRRSEVTPARGFEDLTKKL